MALAYLTAGSTTVASAGWSDATGFADNATLIIDQGSQTVTDGLTSGSGLTTGINYLHGRKGFTGIVGSAGAPLTTKFDGTYTTLPNIIWTSGVLYLTCTNACPKLRVHGGTVVVVSGTVTSLEVTGGQVDLLAAVDVDASEISGGYVRDVAASSNTTNTCVVYDGAYDSDRIITTLTNVNGRVSYGYTTGATTVNQYGGRIDWKTGSITTLNQYGGIFDARRAERDLTISTANLYPTANFQTKASGATVTVTSQVDKLGGPSYLAETP